MANEIFLEKIQLGKETVPGTAVAATYVWSGKGVLKFLDNVVLPDYTIGSAFGSHIEDAYISSTGSELTLSDTELTAEGLVWLANAGIQSVLGPATIFTFDCDDTPNSLTTFTFEVVSGVQEWEFPYGFATKIGLHGSAVDQNGICQMNATIVGRKATASTATPALSQIANREPLSLRGATFKLNALGTAFGTGTAISGTLRAFSVDFDGLWKPQYYADARASLDFSTSEGGAVVGKISGEVVVALNASMVTEIANARAGTGRIMEIALSGSNNRAVKIQLPVVWQPQGIQIGDQESDGLRLVRIPFEARRSRTTTAQSPQIEVTLSTSTTVT